MYSIPPPSEDGLACVPTDEAINDVGLMVLDSKVRGAVTIFTLDGESRSFHFLSFFSTYMYPHTP